MDNARSGTDRNFQAACAGAPQRPPARTPASIVNRLNAAINEGLRTEEMQTIITRLGAVTNPGTPGEFGAFIASQFEKWTAVGKAANVKID